MLQSVRNLNLKAASLQSRTFAIDEIKKGKVTYRVDKEGNVNLAIGKTSFTDEALVENFNAIFNTIAKARPATVKGAYMKNLVVSTTMGPGIHVEIVK